MNIDNIAGLEKVLVNFNTWQQHFFSFLCQMHYEFEIGIFP